MQPDSTGVSCNHPKVNNRLWIATCYGNDDGLPMEQFYISIEKSTTMVMYPHRAIHEARPLLIPSKIGAWTKAC